MGKGHLLGAVSRFLYSVGESIQFRPESTFAPPYSQEEIRPHGAVFLSYRLRIKSALAKMGEQSFTLSLLSGFFRRFFHTRVRSFGVFFFVCGFLQILSYFLGAYLPLLGGNEDNLVFGVCLIFLTLLCSFTRGDVKDALKKSFLFASVLQPLFGVEAPLFPAERSRDNSAFMVASAAFLAFISVVFSPVAVLGVILALVLTLFLFVRPEAGLIYLGLSVLFLSEKALLIVTLLTLVSFLAKCTVGRRSLVFSYRDLPALLFLLLLAIPFGVKTVLCLMALTLLALGLLRSLVWIRRFLLALTLGALLCAALLCLRTVSEALLPAVAFGALQKSGLFPLAPSEGLCASLAVIAPLSAGLFRSTDSAMQRLAAILNFVLSAVAVFTYAPFGIRIAFTASLLVMLLFTYRAAFLLMIMGGIAFGTLLRVLPLPFLEKILWFFGLEEGQSAAGDAGALAFLHRESGPYLLLIFLLLFALFLFRTFRFSALATRSEPFPQVLGGLGAMMTLAVIAFLPVSVSFAFPAILALLLQLPRVALSAAKREQIRLLY